MTEQKTKAKRGPTEKLTKLREQQAQLAAQIKAQEKKLREREVKKLNDRLLEVGRLAEAAGVLFASDEDLTKALQTVASTRAAAETETPSV